jgi:hypothetical protein
LEIIDKIQRQGVMSRNTCNAFLLEGGKMRQRKLEKYITDLEMLEVKRAELEKQKEEIKAYITGLEADEIYKTLTDLKLSERQQLIFLYGLKNGSIELRSEEGKLYVNGKEVKAE